MGKVTFHVQRLEYEQMDLRIKVHIMIINFALTRESQEADDARSRRFQDERKEWISRLQVGDRLTICMHENVGEEISDGVVISIGQWEISISILNTEDDRHFIRDDIMTFSQAEWTYWKAEVYYTIENPQTYLDNKMEDLLWTTQLEVDIPHWLSRKRSIIRRIVGDPKSNTMIIKGIKYTVVQKLDWWNIVKHEDGTLGLCDIRLDDFYGEIEF